MCWNDGMTAIESSPFLLHWKGKVVMLANLLALTAPDVAILTSTSATRDDRFINLANLRVSVYIFVPKWNKAFQQLHCVVFPLVCPVGIIVNIFILNQSQRSWVTQRTILVWASATCISVYFNSDCNEYFIYVHTDLHTHMYAYAYMYMCVYSSSYVEKWSCVTDEGDVRCVFLSK